MTANILSFHETEIEHDDTPLDLFLDIEFDSPTNFDEWQIADD